MEARLVYRGYIHLRREDSSLEREIHIRRRRLVYGGGNLSTEGEICLLRGRFIYGGGESSTEGKTRLKRERLIYRTFLMMVEQNDIATKSSIVKS
jgi:hypothetical protein